MHPRIWLAQTSQTLCTDQIRKRRVQGLGETRAASGIHTQGNSSSGLGPCSGQGWPEWPPEVLLLQITTVRWFLFMQTVIKQLLLITKPSCLTSPASHIPDSGSWHCLAAQFLFRCMTSKQDHRNRIQTWPEVLGQPWWLAVIQAKPQDKDATKMLQINPLE